MGDLGRYMVFAGQQYYPGGGTNDLIGIFNTLEEAQACASSRKSDDWWEIFDFFERDVVAYG